jgi:hypothetical protein
VWPTLGLPASQEDAARLVARLRAAAGPGEADGRSDAELLEGWLKQRERLIELERADPLRHGWEGDHWQDARRLLEGHDELLVLGGNRAGKTEFAAKLAVETLLGTKGARVWCLHSSAQSSVGMQQPFIYRYLPPELRDIGKRGRVTNVSYTVKNGFSEATFVLPNGSQAWFMNYTQDVKVIEGGECDLIWCDELVPYDWVETLRYRLVTRRGKLVITFTPVTGYSLVVKDYVAGAEVVETRPSALLAGTVNVPGCPRGTMPYVLQPVRRNQAVVCFHAGMNPYSSYEQLAAAVAGRPSVEVKVRAYGWAEKLMGHVFPKFGPVNVVEEWAVPAEGTNYVSVDPAGAKNWFVLWLRVDVVGRIWVYREWPNAGLGEWALPSEKPDGKVGPAQRLEGGRGIVGYKQLFLGLEGVRETDGKWDWSEAEAVYERLIDPRAGNAAVPGEEEGTSIVEMMCEEQRDKDGRLTGPSMVFAPAPACKVDEGAVLINDALDYRTEEPVTALNAPRLYVVRTCANLIWALREWTGLDGEKGACKDPIDALKYALKRGVEYVDVGKGVCRMGKGY